MAQYGSLLIRAFTSRAQLPVAGATVVVSALEENNSHRLESVLITDESGVAGPIQLAAADSSGLTPGGPTPYKLYTLWIEHPDYEVAYIENLQVFAGVETIQKITLIPIAPPGAGGTAVDNVVITPQPL